MKAQSQSLQSRSRQAYEMTFGTSCFPGARVNFKQNVKVPNRGSSKEKTTQLILEFVCISVFLLSLFLTGCSKSFVSEVSHREDVASHSNGTSVLEMGSQSSLPTVGEPAGAQTSKNDPNMAPEHSQNQLVVTGSEGTFRKFIQEEAVIERVRSVTGWLKFVHQKEAEALVVSGWDRVKSGKFIGPLKLEELDGYPEVSAAELMLWRELVRTESVRKNTAANAERAVAPLAVALTLAKTPDDLLGADNLLVVSEPTPGY